MEHTNNSVHLRGTILELPAFSHENHGKVFYRFILEVQRLSGTMDYLPVIVPEQVLSQLDPCGGSMLEVCGQIRSCNSRSDSGRKLIVSVYADQLIACDGEPMNQIALTGVICKEPVYRKTPLGREICDIMLAVNRKYHRSDYIPCIFWGQTAELAAVCPVGTTVSLTGRMQSRDYVKILEHTSEQRTAYEVSVMTAEFFG